MFNILTYNHISPRGLKRFPAGQYHLSDKPTERVDAILLRSYDLHNAEIAPEVKAVGRAGAGVNNIPVDWCSGRGIPVFNTPGANANAVKELVLAGMLIAARNLMQAWQYTDSLVASGSELSGLVEKGKKQFVGYELPGRTLGVIGLGAIGVRVANAAVELGMRVIGYDPGLTLENAWQLSSRVKRARSLEELLRIADFVTPHVPLNEHTGGMLGEEQFRLMKQGVVILNFARDGLIDGVALASALDTGHVSHYICDFPALPLKDHARVVAFPHLGASTGEAEDNCAVMVADQLKDYLENGNIRNAVNFPDVEMPRTEGVRLTVANANVPNMVGQVSTMLASAGLNILDLLNRSQGSMAYTLIDLDARVPDFLMQQLAGIDGVLMVRQL